MDPKILIEHDTDEHGAVCMRVTGVDRERVYDAALDLKNGFPIALCPEVYGPRIDLDSGCWRAMVLTRRIAP
ncbi:hypothetical protein [Paraburkholderia mimosarum]|uniref:hypothetical protein n=1 Tax=Paraburkholderia mimosarum TaxID=312026 RepID=UPI0003FAD773|nr:hypothetical protein [Paraburkholderia mimosarum]